MDEQYITESIDTLVQIQVGQKLAVSTGKFQIVNKPIGIFRWLSGDNKNVTVLYIKHVFDNAILKNILFDGKLVLQAIENLKITYHKHLSTVGELTKIQLDIKNEMYVRDRKK